MTFFTVQEPHQKLDVTAINVVQVHPRPTPEPAPTPPWEEVRQALRAAPRRRDARRLSVRVRLAVRQARPGAGRLRRPVLPARPAAARGRPRPDAPDLHRVPLRLRRDDLRHPAAAKLLENRRGVCQDFAHLQIGCLRSLGLAARYVSGYLLTNPPPGQERLIGADMSHAWVSVFCPGFGWIDFDPTNDVIPREKHITLAWGRDYDDVSPIKGVILGGGRHSISVGVDVT